MTGAVTLLDSRTVLAVARFLEENAADLGTQAAGLRALAGYFSPLFNPRYTPGDPLHYYRQREWRITTMWVRNGVKTTTPCTTSQKQQLLELNPAFFSKAVKMRDRTGPQVDFCEYLTLVAGKPLLSTIRRIIAPEAHVGDVEALLGRHGIAIPVRTLESL